MRHPSFSLIKKSFLALEARGVPEISKKNDRSKKKKLRCSALNTLEEEAKFFEPHTELCIKWPACMVCRAQHAMQLHEMRYVLSCTAPPFFPPAFLPASLPLPAHSPCSLPASLPCLPLYLLALGCLMHQCIAYWHIVLYMARHAAT